MSVHRIAITGASTGLGAALALALAGRGVSMHICARRAGPLDALADSLRAAGAEVRCSTVDLRDPLAATSWAEAAWSEGPLDMLILNAGIFDGCDMDGRLESPDRAAALIATNLTGAMIPALALADRMRARGTGAMVFISSLSAFGPQADAPSYGASKAGLTAFARALRENLEPQGVRVIVAHPGHIRTAQTEQQSGPLPGLMTAEEAARRILRAMARGRSEINFPVYLRLGLSILAWLPWKSRIWLTRSLRFSVRPPE